MGEREKEGKKRESMREEKERGRGRERENEREKERGGGREREGDRERAERRETLGLQGLPCSPHLRGLQCTLPHAQKVTTPLCCWKNTKQKT